MIAKLAPIVFVLSSATARAQAPVELRDDQIAAIAQDPAVKVDDDKVRAVTTTLLTEAVRRLEVQAYDQALANLLEAYNRFPSPKILMAIGSTLHTMGRKADAANTYQRYLADPGAAPESVAEIKELLEKLDNELTILAVRVAPRGSEVSIDAGPFVAVGGLLQLRVRPGTHTIRLRHGGKSGETDVASFAGETREVAIAVDDDHAGSVAEPPERVQGWLVEGRGYSTSDGNSRQRRVHVIATGQDLRPSVSSGELELAPSADLSEPPEHLGSGVIALARIDGNHWKGFAGGVGIAYAASDMFEVNVAGLKSEIYGLYLGARYIFSRGQVRPYLAAGVPVFFFTDDSNRNQIGVGGRLAAGLEVRITAHLGIDADLGIEHFFNVAGVIYNSQTFDATAFAPTLGVIGRL